MTIRDCPFCGGRPHYTEGDRETRQPDRVECLCGVEIEVEYEPGAALAIWNKRVDEEPIPPHTHEEETE